MRNKIKNAVKKFSKSVKKIDFVNAENFAENLGFTTVFFNTPEGDLTLLKCGYSEEDKKYKAFTHIDTAKIIFINNNVENESKLYLLLHEIGHILLGHIGDGQSNTRNPVLMDVETDAFVNEVLHYKKFNYWLVLYTIVMLILGFSVGNIMANNGNPTNPNIEPVNALDDVISDNQNDTVYVTPTGTKFHRIDCRYTKDKDCKAMSRAEAVQNYAPCKVCKP